MLQRVTELLRELGGDVVALQEVTFDEHSGRPLIELATALDLYATAGPTLRRNGKLFGNVLLSRRPALEVQRLELRGLEPRCALAAWLPAGSDRLCVVTTHLGLSRFERRRQVMTLCGWAPLRANAVVVAGDLNAWIPGLDAARLLQRRLKLRSLGAPLSFPALRPVVSLDRVLVHPELAAGRARAVATPGARAASDHLPVVAEVELTLTEGAERSEEPPPRLRVLRARHRGSTQD